ncbi:ComEC family competence protein [Candidatus Brocadiaceae bacterium S225]|uniref:Competence protein ComA n=1 Tax=Candidatus Scalindua brodae TaxID=237368 RepID=A0A0B0EQE4_9BACT|nr:MAG: competence protein ComA [Candidatus Scalindua brodae]TWU36343.1 ComEC family competence protein [Candidatus Brocadiaceae bacterium S225]
MTHRPLVGIVVSFSLGICTNYLINIPFIPVFSTAITFAIANVLLFIFHPCPAGISRRAKGGILALLILVFLTGIAYHHLRFFSHAGNNISNFINTDKIPVRLQGVVASPPISKSVTSPLLNSIKYRKEMSTFLLRAEAIENTVDSGISGTLLRKWRKISGTIKVNIYQTQQEQETTLVNKCDSLSEELEYGDKIELICNLSIPSTSRNPGQFDYQNFLKKQSPRVEAIASVVSLNNIEILSEGHGSFFYTFIYGLKKKLNTVIEKQVKKESIPLVCSILLGDRGKVSQNLMEGFLKTGTIHFLAISGLHVGILVVTLHCLLRLIQLNTRYLAIIIILIVFIYVAIIGMKTPIIRAGIMAAMYYGAFIINRRWDLPNSIAAAVFIILLINPSDLFNVGFQLSVLAVLGIIYTSNRLENFFWRSTLLVEKLQDKEERSEIWFLLTAYCRKSFCVSLGAWVAVMPLIAYYFHIVTPLTVFLNIIIFPLVWLILIGGFIVLITGLVFPILATPFAWLVSYSGVTLGNMILLFSNNFRIFFYTSTPLWIWIVIYYLIVMFFILRERIKIKLAHLIIATLSILTVFVFSGLPGRGQDCLKLTCFDVRHGASFFIQFPNGKNMLYDSGTRGNYDVGKFIVAPFLWQQGIKKIDTVIISHKDDDHCNGIPSIINRFSVGNALVNKFFLQSGNKIELLNMLVEKRIKIGLLSDGLEIKNYGTAKISVLNPPDKDVLQNEGILVGNISTNDSSNVLLIEYMGNRILLCGDIGEKGIEMLLSGNGGHDADISADIIQVPHHGGFIVNTGDLVKSVKPLHAIINGLTKDISPSTIEEYQKQGASLHKTHESGAVTFMINREGIKVSTFL